jgi:hypothetical protein
MTILHIILDEHADDFEYGLVLGNTMPEALLKDLKAFDPAIERFMASFGPSFEGLNQIRILAIAGCNLLLASVPFVSNHLLPDGDHGLEAIWCSIHLQVIVTCTKGAIDPNKLIAADGNPKLVGQPWLLELVGVPLGTWLCPRLINAAVNSVDCNNMNLLVIVLIVPMPNNLVIE